MTAAPVRTYPPTFSDDKLGALITEIKDYQLTHGSLIKLVRHEEAHSVLARPIGVSVFPTLFPKSCFKQANALQPIFSKLYAAIAQDTEWLFEVLEELIEKDDLVATLWDVHAAVQKEGVAQDVVAGIFRSDYMLHAATDSPSSPLQTAAIKQVEFNAYSVAGGVHGSIVNSLHHDLSLSGRYSSPLSSSNPPITNSSIPTNPTTSNLVSFLASTHSYYNPTTAHPTCILILVQGNNVNIADERPLEYGLRSFSPSIPTFRMEFSQSLSAYTDLQDDRTLIFHPPWDTSQKYEVAIAYMRAGYDAFEYDNSGIGREARLRIERARAIKCPSIGAHLATLKMVQTALWDSSALSRFLTPTEADLVSAVAMPIYGLADPAARSLATSTTLASNYVLKPSLEGGGHNVYRSQIPDYLSNVPESEWSRYVLMELITPPEEIENVLLVPEEGIYEGKVVSELGIFGTCLWRASGEKSACGKGVESGVDEKVRETPHARGVEMLSNEVAGWSFKTKPAHVDEMSVVKGYGCFDSPLLVG